MDISYIIVNYNTKELTAQCIESIKQSSGSFTYEIIVVDNDSKDGSIEYLENLFSNIILIKSEVNGGFAYANNIGINIAKGRYVFLVNSDTVLDSNTTYEMMHYLDNNKDIGALTCRVIDGQGKKLPSGHAFSNLSFLIIQTFNLKKLVPKQLYKFLSKMRFKSATFYTGSITSDKPLEVDWITGACMMVPRQVIKSVGGLNESFFMYMEDEEWCRRIKNNGWKIKVFPKVKICHLVGGSGSGSLKVVSERFRSMLLYHKKYNEKNYNLIKLFVIIQVIKVYFTSTKKFPFNDIFNLVKSIIFDFVKYERS